MEPTILSKNSKIAKYDAFLFDCDGVLWNGNSLIEGVKELLPLLRENGKKVFFVSNNSAISRADYLRKLEKLGIVAFLDEVFPASYAAAKYLEDHGFSNSDKKAYVVGESGIIAELENVNIKAVGGPSDKNKESAGRLPVIVDSKIDAVVIGYDRHINYYKMQYAFLCIKELKAKFIATNRDAWAKSEYQPFVGGGAMVAAVAASTSTDPIVVGKPSVYLFELIQRYAQVDKTKCLMVGDRIDTDIAFAKQNGIDSVMVFTGVTHDFEMLKTEMGSWIPTFYTDSVADFLRYF